MCSSDLDRTQRPGIVYQSLQPAVEIKAGEIGREKRIAVLMVIICFRYDHIQRVTIHEQGRCPRERMMPRAIRGSEERRVGEERRAGVAPDGGSNT